MQKSHLLQSDANAHGRPPLRPRRRKPTLAREAGSPLSESSAAADTYQSWRASRTGRAMAPWSTLGATEIQRGFRRYFPGGAGTRWIVSPTDACSSMQDEETWRWTGVLEPWVTGKYNEHATNHTDYHTHRRTLFCRRRCRLDTRRCKLRGGGAGAGPRASHFRR